MLRKLMKHELRATGRIMLPMLLLVLVTAVGANIATRTLLEADSNVLDILGAIVLMAFVLSITAVCFVAFILMVQRFYKNLLQDEGYIMMTLPVSTHKHVISKLFVSMLWFALSIAVVILSCLILVYKAGMVKGIIVSVFEIFRETDYAELLPHAAAYIAEFIVFVFLAGAASCLQFYMAMAIGFSFSSRKILMSVVAYFAVRFLLQIAGIIILQLLDSGGIMELLDSTLYGLSNIAAAHTAMIGLSLLALMLSAIFYFPTVWFLKHRLNLE